MEDRVKYMMKPELRAFLLQRGMTVSDYRVEQLRELACKAIEMKLPVVKTEDDTISSLQQRTTFTINERTVSFPFVFDVSLNQWSDNLNRMPSIQCADLFAHLLMNAHWPRERLKLYKQERGYHLYTNHHIHTVSTHMLLHDYMYVRGFCIRETSQSEKPYLVWCLIDCEGTIKSAGCECTADDGGCKHVVAMLFSLMDWGERHLDRNTQSCTDIPCAWDFPRRESKPRKMDDIKMTDKERVHPSQNNFYPVINDMNNNDDAEMEKAIFDLVKDCDTQIIEVLDPGCDIPDDPPTIQATAYSFDKNASQSFIEHVKSEIGEKECSEISLLTQGQNSNINWYKYRSGRVTASLVNNVVKYKGNDLNNYIVRDILSEGPGVSTAAMEYGKERESLARELYQLKFQKDHDQFSIELPGLLVNHRYPHIGASPDGIVTCKCCHSGLIEIKCPYKYRSNSLHEICNENYHVYLGSSGKMKLKQTSPWYYQIQCQLAVSDLAWCDFVLYLEGLGSCKHQIHVDRISFNKEMWDQCMENINAFYLKFVVPNMLSN